MEEEIKDKQRIIKIASTISEDLDFVSKETGTSKSVIVEQQMKAFIETAKRGDIQRQPEKKAVGIVVNDEIFDEFKSICKNLNYGVGEALEILINQFNLKNIQEMNDKKNNKK